MNRARQIVYAVVTAGCLLVFAQGCEKTVHGTSGSKTMEQGQAKHQPPPAQLGPSEPASQPGSSEPALEAGPSEPASQPGSSEPALQAGPLEPASQPGSSEPALQPGPLEPAPLTLPGEERVADDIVVAKAEPEAARQRTQEMQQEATATATTGLQDVFFAFDSWKITETAKRVLQADAQWLKANGHRAITIEGHCDERGTQAYNLVLGEKRAKAVRNYLIDLGVDPMRLAVASYGKDRPFCREHNEDCYQQNRRGHLVLRVK